VVQALAEYARSSKTCLRCRRLSVATCRASRPPTARKAFPRRRLVWRRGQAEGHRA